MALSASTYLCGLCYIGGGAYLTSVPNMFIVLLRKTSKLLEWLLSHLVVCVHVQYVSSVRYIRTYISSCHITLTHTF